MSSRRPSSGSRKLYWSRILVSTLILNYSTVHNIENGAFTLRIVKIETLIQMLTFSQFLIVLPSFSQWIFHLKFWTIVVLSNG